MCFAKVNGKPIYEILFLDYSFETLNKSIVILRGPSLHGMNVSYQQKKRGKIKKTTTVLQIFKDLFSPLSMYVICAFHFTLIFCQALERTVECYIPFHVPITQFTIKISVHVKKSNLL